MPTNSTKVQIYIIKADVCLSVFGHSNVRLTTTPVLMLWGTQGYLWLPYDPTEVINLIGERFKPKNLFFSKKYFMSFLPHYCHSFCITVIPSGLLSFLPDFCHSFRIIVIPSLLVSLLPNIVIPSELLPFQIFVTLNSSGTQRARKITTRGGHICDKPKYLVTLVFLRIYGCVWHQQFKIPNAEISRIGGQPF